ncbi:MAG: hypothetical protein WAZ34_05735 [Rhodocyclaceae bacterium]
MTISGADLADLIREIEVDDPIDYGDLPYDEGDLRLLVCNQIRDIAEQAGQLGEESCQTVLLAVAAKLVLENLVLHIKLLQAQGSALDDSCEALFRRLRGGAC